MSFVRHNARIYGVADRIRFVHDDFVKFADNYTGAPVDAVFLSPPWGGPGHLDCPHFSLRDVQARQLQTNKHTFGHCHLSQLACISLQSTLLRSVGIPGT